MVTPILNCSVLLACRCLRRVLVMVLMARGLECRGMLLYTAVSCGTGTGNPLNSVELEKSPAMMNESLYLARLLAPDNNIDNCLMKDTSLYVSGYQ